MNWALHLIGSHPEVQKTMQAELQEVFGTQVFSTMWDVFHLA